jgi:hypothetical protein
MLASFRSLCILEIIMYPLEQRLELMTSIFLPNDTLLGLCDMQVVNKPRFKSIKQFIL